MLLLPWITLFIVVKSWLKSGKNQIESKGVRKLKNPEFWVCRLKCRSIAIAMPNRSRDIAVALPSRAAALLPGICTESPKGRAAALVREGPRHWPPGWYFQGFKAREWGVDVWDRYMYSYQCRAMPETLNYGFKPYKTRVNPLFVIVTR